MRRRGPALTQTQLCVTCNEEVVDMRPVGRRVGDHRKRMADRGLRIVQIWIPDTRKPGFADECLRQSLSLRSDPEESKVLGFIEDVAEWPLP